MFIRLTDNPETEFNRWRSDRSAASSKLALRYRFAQYYLDQAPGIELLALFQVDGDGIFFTVGEANEALCRELSACDIDLRQFCSVNGWPLLRLDDALKLQPVAIAKPWGQEIWYTGIEQRGLSRVTDGESSVPLPWVLSALPQHLAAGHERRINLLKILDPLPEEVFGDLYFELHEEKREVYVVTHVDEHAWPGGTGSIRFGFDQQLRATYSSDEAFKSDYLAAVRAYEQARREIDLQVDEFRLAEGVEENAPVPAKQLKQWLSRLPVAQRAREESLRQQMNRFTALLPLHIGDVVKVPLRTPHALQHGVRTVEFQTPVYERRILAFAQKVLTQGHWDTEQAVEMMSLDAPQLPELTVLLDNSDCRLEEVVNFDDFRVERLTLAADATYTLPDSSSYVLVMSVDGGVSIGGQVLAAEEAALVPAQRSLTDLENRSRTSATLLMAWPT
ncbi:MAG: hypothetical protein EP334_07285 [Gammaproteobacteria bacterium]|nr:MAG: hypothetical protein EP334_07285 [Gammaproteobacteria bacterium]